MSDRKRRKGPEQREQPVPDGLGGDPVPVFAQSDLSDDAQIALKEMIDEYDRGMEEERRFRDGATAADRTGSTARPRLRYLRAAAAAETSQPPSH
jgi:hypothetical protein